ncbi:Gluconate 2-dehydrogenase flavoprotein precursor [Serratia rubidaea]|uniref:Gluconate 2-dehydrogenase flavoprotein n=1 Tax=Serratia rubidaea TaxID=61652 RepID=A0A4U9HTV2_SERRU|nr:Gluconate 2-dehydrogenase flavoprotein precursor [Serratia rubidaea]
MAKPPPASPISIAIKKSGSSRPISWVLSAFQMQNVRLLLLSKIGQPYDPVSKTGVVGRAYSFQTVAGANLFFEDENLNPFIGAGALSQQVDDL